MSFYWIYDIPLWLFFIILISFFIIVSIIGELTIGEFCKKKFNLTKENNDVIQIYLALSGLFYGLTLGMIAVNTFDNFNTVKSIVNEESSSLAGLYRDVSILEKDEKLEMKLYLKKYTTFIVEKAWPLQQQGIIPKDGTHILDTFQMKLSEYTPKTEKDKIVYQEVFDQYNVLIEKRRLRLNSVTSSLPGIIWLILFVGSIVNFILTWLLVVDNRNFELFLNILIGILMGSLIFWIAAMDHPYRGEYSVSSEPFKLLLDSIMK